MTAALFGVAVWNAQRADRFVSYLFFLFVPLVAWGMIASVGVSARILGMLVVFIAAAIFLWRRSRE